MPQASPDRPAVVRFGPFALDLQSGELSRDGARTRLQDQPFALLRCLLEHPGQLVTRDELRRRLWPHGTMVDFEHGVNTALKRLRDALGDEAEHPVYIETVPRRGYRFVAAVEVGSLDTAGPVTPRGGPGRRDAAPALRGGFVSAPPAGSYRILEQIDAGGMGEIYRAEDLLLKRTVALKVLPAAFASDPDRLARFQREAEALASLNHPHICTLHAIGEALPTELGVVSETDDAGVPQVSRRYLVMEYLDGQTLAARLEKGPLPAALVCDLGAQIADALAAAHKHGVVHRDLKPANIMLTGTSSGRAGVPHVKLLDFGLAKLAGHGEQPALSFDSAAETRRATLTGQGTVLGTLPYMAPEQVEGKEADARTDVWALGTVLYEMATGRQAFTADSAVSLASQILTADPASLSSHQPLTPPALEHVVTTCLAKDPELRWQAASDVARELRWIADACRLGPTPGSGSTSDAATAAALASARRARRWRIATGAAGLVAVVAVVTAASMWQFLGLPAGPGAIVVRSEINTSPVSLLGGFSDNTNVPFSLNRPSRTVIALTPDGRYLLFAGGEDRLQRLYVNDLAAGTTAAIPGTESADAPFLSPDGRWVGFWAADARALKKVPLDGSGPPVEICKARSAFGASWGDDDTIVFVQVPDDGLWRVPASGGSAPKRLTAPGAGEHGHRLPHVLPGSRAVLFTTVARPFDWEDARVVVHEYGTGSWREVARGSDGRYLSTGHLVYFRHGQLLATAFDLVQLKPVGTERVIVGDVMQATNALSGWLDTGAAQAAVSDAGTLAFVTGGQVPDVRRQLVWVNRRGKVEPLSAPPKSYYRPRLSPDGQKVAVHTFQSDRRVWVHDLRVAGSLDPIPTPPGMGAMDPTWTTDSMHLIVDGYSGGKPGLFRARADGTGSLEPLFTSDRFLVPGSWTPDGRLLFFSFSGGPPSGGWDVRLLSRREGGWTAEDLLATSANEWDAQVSRDGWLAFATSDGNPPVRALYIQRFPGPSERRRVTGNEAASVLWAPSGDELFYLTGLRDERTLMARDIGPGGAVGPTGRVLFTLAPLSLGFFQPGAGFDVTSDGQRFIFAQALDAPPSSPHVIHLVVNWLEELKAKVPAGK